MKYASFILLILLFGGCVSDFNAKLPETESDALVFEGSIVGNSELTFYVSKTFSLNSGVPTDYNGVQADIAVIGNNGYRSATAQYQGAGVHKLNLGELNTEVAYGVEIKYNGETYQSDLQKPLVTPAIDNLSWEQPVENGNVSIRVSTHDDSDQSQYFIWTYDEEWEEMANYRATYMYDPLAEDFYEDESAPYHYCWHQRKGSEILIGNSINMEGNKIVNHQLLSYVPTDRRLSLLYRIRVKQCAITKESYSYHESKKKFNSEMGGLFTPQPAELSSNIVCTSNPSRKIMGRVDVTFNIAEAVMYIPKSELTIPWQYSPCEIKTAEAFQNDLGIQISDDQFYHLGFRPVTLDPATGIVTWSAAECADCRYNGGSKTKPEYWPNNHQ